MRILVFPKIEVLGHLERTNDLEERGYRRLRNCAGGNTAQAELMDACGDDLSRGVRQIDHRSFHLKCDSLIRSWLDLLKPTAMVAALMINPELLQARLVNALPDQGVAFLAEPSNASRHSSAGGTHPFPLALQGTECHKRLVNNEDRYDAAVIASKLCAKRERSRGTTWATST